MVTLKRELGLIGGISYVAGTIIGSGIFISPSTVLLGCAGSVGLTLCMWTISGCVALCEAFSYAELGSRIGKSGGPYTYIREAFGDFLAFLFLWVNLLFTRPMSAAIGCMASAQYIMSAIFCTEAVPGYATTLLTLVILVFITAMNCYSSKLGAYYQTVSTSSKVAVLVVIVGAGLVHLGQGRTEHFDSPFNVEDVTVLGLVKAFYGSYFAYGGCNAICYGAEEFVRSKRTLPLAILIGVLIPTVVYVSTIVAYHAVLTNDEITSGIAVALAFSRYKFGYFQWIVLPLIGMFAAVSVNTNVFRSSRLNFVAGRDKLFPRFLSMANIYYRTPLVSISLLMVSAMIVILIGDDIKSIIPTYTFTTLLATVTAVMSLKNIRQKYPDTESTVRVPSALPVTFAAITILLSIIFVILETKVLVSTGIILGSGAVVYFLSKSSFINIGPMKIANSYIVMFCHRILLCEFSTEINDE